MLSFDSSIQKSADLKTQSSSGSWVERVLLTPSNIYLWTSSFALSSSKTLWGGWGCVQRPLGHHFGGNFEKLKKNILSDFVVVNFFLFCYDFLDFLDFLSFFQRPLLLHPLQKHFQGVDNVDFLFFWFFLFVWFFSNFLK